MMRQQIIPPHHIESTMHKIPGRIRRSSSYSQHRVHRMLPQKRQLPNGIRLIRRIDAEACHEPPPRRTGHSNNCKADRGPLPPLPSARSELRGRHKHQKSQRDIRRFGHRAERERHRRHNQLRTPQLTAFAQRPPHRRYSQRRNGHHQCVLRAGRLKKQRTRQQQSRQQTPRSSPGPTQRQPPHEGGHQRGEPAHQPEACEHSELRLLRDPPSHDRRQV